jgi:SPP1 gp7 family putative phage head morphogenesis protein
MPELNKADKLQLKIISLQEKMQRYENQSAKDVLKIIKELEKELVGIVVELGKGNRTTKKKRLAEIKKQGQKAIQEAYKEIKRLELGFYDENKEFQQGEFHKYAEIESKQTSKVINETATDIEKPIVPETSQSAVNAVVSTALVTGKINKDVISRPIKFWWDKQSSSVQEKFILQMEDGLNAGETVVKLIKRLSGDKKLISVTENNAATLARTAANAVGNNSALETFRKNSDIIEGVRWAATLDRRTCLRCASHSDLEWTLDGKPIGHNFSFKPLPLHPNCRCVYVPILIGYPRMSDITYETWFNQQTRQTQEEVMGVTKRRMRVEGKLSLSKMVDDKARILNLEELDSMGIKLLD